MTGRVALHLIRPDQELGTEITGMVARSETPEKTGGAIEAVRAQRVEAQQNLWQYGLVLMLGVLVLESMVGRA